MLNPMGNISDSIIPTTNSTCAISNAYLYILFLFFILFFKSVEIWFNLYDMASQIKQTVRKETRSDENVMMMISRDTRLFSVV